MRSLFAFLLFVFFVSSPSLAQSRADGAPPAMLGFGSVLAMSHGEVLVGSASVDWPSGSDPAGEVYRFARQSDGSWAEIGRVSAPDGGHGDEFGRSILVDGDHLYVGAPALDAVYIYERTGGMGPEGDWEYSDRLEAPQMADGFEFGGTYARGGHRTQTIARAADFTAVSSYNVLTDEGAVHVYGNGDTMRTIMRDAVWSVAGVGSMFFVGVPSAQEGRGEVHVFEYDGITWSKRQTLEGLTANSQFGRSMASDGERLFVSAIDHEGIGAVMVFGTDMHGNWAHYHVLSQPISGEARPAGDFGRNLAVSDDHLAITAQNAAFVVSLDDLNGDMIRLDAPGMQRGRNYGVGVSVADGVLAVGAPSADYGSGRAIVYEHQSDDTWDEAFDALGDVTAIESITGEEVLCDEDGLVQGLFPCDDVDLVSMVSAASLVHDRGANLNDIWGWEDPVTGIEYVLAARTDGLSFVDISNPSNPVEVGQLMRTEGSPGAWWRDVKVYNDHAYVVADGSGEHGMQIFDLTRLRDIDPSDIPVDFDPDATYHEVGSTHNIVINEQSGFGYAVGSDECGGQLHMMDLRDPLNPVFQGCYTHPDFGGTHDAQCVMYNGPDTDYRGREICLNSNGSAFIIVDVTEKSNPVTVAVANYPNSAYTHQGWLTEDHSHFFMNDELDEMNNIVEQTRTLIWDLEDLDEPVLAREYYLDNGASDHNLYINGNTMYQSNYQAGLRVFDVTDPLNPEPIGHFDTAPWADDVEGFAGSWSNYPFFKSGIIAVSSQAEGLFLVRKREIDM